MTFHYFLKVVYANIDKLPLVLRKKPVIFLFNIFQGIQAFFKKSTLSKSQNKIILKSIEIYLSGLEHLLFCCFKCHLNNTTDIMYAYIKHPKHLPKPALQYDIDEAPPTTTILVILVELFFLRSQK